MGLIFRALSPTFLYYDLILFSSSFKNMGVPKRYAFLHYVLSLFLSSFRNMAVPTRYILVLCTHFGFFIVYALRVNLSVALVAMVAEKNETISHDDNHKKVIHFVDILS